MADDGQHPVDMCELKEQTKHGDEGFPVGWYPRLSKVWQGYFFVPHWHRELELIFVESGKMELVVQGQSYLLQEGSVALLPPNLLHTAYQLEGSACCFSCIVFAPEFVTGQTSEAVQKDLLVMLFASDFREELLVAGPMAESMGLSDYLRKLGSALNQREQIVNQLKIKGLLFLVIAILLGEAGNPKLANGGKNQLQQAREKIILGYMADHLAEKVTLAELSSQLNLSKEQFSRFFRQAFRRSPLQYLTQMRLQKACHLLTQEDLTMLEIAEACGFDNSNYFSRVFKQHFGMSPSEFQRK